jgi:sialic acid synthase SpsE
MENKMKIADCLVGIGEPCFIIAEAGSNHNGKISQAKELIDIASDSGANAVKFQLFSADTLYSEKATPYSIIRDNELNRDWINELVEYANNKGIIFLSTPFDKEAIDQLYEIDAPAYKWSSLEIVNLPLLRYASSKGKPIIISTGVSNLADIQDALDAVYASGNREVILLHCASLFEYPQKPHLVNLRMIDTMAAAFHVPVGFSDHTLSISIPAAAVARGACVIEKHFTISRKLKGPDHSFALEANELKQMVKAIREVEESLGSPIKQAIPEEEMVVPQRPSVIASVNIKKGTKITEDMMMIKRPGYGVKPKFANIIVGRVAIKDIEKGDGITWEAI